MQRYYDPALGRYITSDPIGINGGLNTYVYVLDNPMRFSDRLARKSHQGDRKRLLLMA